jgi:hypothetical protein
MQRQAHLYKFVYVKDNVIMCKIIHLQVYLLVNILPWLLSDFHWRHQILFASAPSTFIRASWHVYLCLLISCKNHFQQLFSLQELASSRKFYSFFTNNAFKMFEHSETNIMSDFN